MAYITILKSLDLTITNGLVEGNIWTAHNHVFGIVTRRIIVTLAFTLFIMPSIHCSQVSKPYPTPKTATILLTPTVKPSLTHTSTPVVTPIAILKDAIQPNLSSTPLPSPEPTATKTAAPIKTPNVSPQARTFSSTISHPETNPTVVNPTPTSTITPNLSEDEKANLSPYIPLGWESQLVLSNLQGTKNDTELTVDSEVFVNWAVANASAANIEQVFFVDLLFDGITIARWRNEGLPSNSIVSIDAWHRLPMLTSITPGVHKLTLIIDPTDLVEETNENDNLIVKDFVWLSSNLSNPTEAKNERLPDLAPFTPKGWSNPIVTSVDADMVIESTLSITIPTHIFAGFTNIGKASIGDAIWSHIYIDDILVDIQMTPGLLTKDSIGRLKIIDLATKINITPGTHTLKLVIDPSNLIIESDETNNIFKKQFTWLENAALREFTKTPTSKVIYPKPLKLPNLTPAWQFGWDGPIIVSNKTGTFRDQQPVLGTTNYIDLVVRNRSIIPVTGPIQIDLYFDDIKLESFVFYLNSSPKKISLIEDWAGIEDLVGISKGEHTLKMIIDPKNLIAEADESDNIFEKTLVWSDKISEAPSGEIYSEQRLNEMLADLQNLLEQKSPTFDSKHDYRESVLRIAEAGYFLLTGKNIWDERLKIMLLSRKNYLNWINEDFKDTFAINEASHYPEIFDQRESIKRQALGFKMRKHGEVLIVIDSSQHIVEAINSLAHELGHAVQDFDNPSQSGVEQTYYLKVLQEAQAQQFQRAFWLKIEQFIGTKLLSYPDIIPFQRFMFEQIQGGLDKTVSDEHWVGLFVQWTAILRDKDLKDLKNQLLSYGYLDGDSSKYFFDFLVSMSPSQVEEYVKPLLNITVLELESILGFGLGRLEEQLEIKVEGPAELRLIGLLMP